MRIAIPVLNDDVHPVPACAQQVQFFEDDHGRIVRRYRLAVEGDGFDALLALLEQQGIDALLCSGALTPAQRRELTMAGLMTFPGYGGAAEQAALSFLSGAVAADPNNTCNACGHRCADGGSCPAR